MSFNSMIPYNKSQSKFKMQREKEKENKYAFTDHRNGSKGSKSFAADATNCQSDIIDGDKFPDA